MIGSFGYQNHVTPGTPEFDALVTRVIHQESRGNPKAVSPVGASGLMQVMPATAREPGFGVKPLPWDQRFDPQANRRFGEEYLSAMLNRYEGNVPKALAAYNWGAGNADKWDGSPGSLPAETRQYIANIQQNANYTKPQYGPSAVGKSSGAKTASTGDMVQTAAGAAAAAVGLSAQANDAARNQDAFTGSFMNLAAIANQPAGYSMPAQIAQPQSTINTPRIQSRYSGPIQQQPLNPVATNLIR